MKTLNFFFSLVFDSDRMNESAGFGRRLVAPNEILESLSLQSRSPGFACGQADVKLDPFVSSASSALSMLSLGDAHVSSRFEYDEITRSSSCPTNLALVRG